MRSELQKYEQIDRYLNNQLKGEDLSLFNQKMERDHSFRQEVDDHRLIHDMVIDHGLIELRKKLRALDPPPTQGTSFVKWGIFITIITIISVIIFYLLPEKRKDIPQTISAVQKQVEEKASSSYSGSQKDSIEKQSDEAPKKDTTSFIKPRVKDVPSEQPVHISLTDTFKSSNVNPEAKKVIESQLPTGKLKTPEPIIKETNPPQTSEITCELHLSKIIIRTVESCYSTPEGKIIIDKGSDLKGKAPFMFSIDQVHYSDEYIFSGLFPGSHELTIKDANNCYWTESGIQVEEKVCRDNEYVIYPSNGEVWKIPVSDRTNGRLEIYNNTGNLVFHAPILNGFPNTWDGTANGQPLPMGSYSFIIKSGSNVLTGNVTIMR